uniref:Uncharacterized protein n=1 Tax=Oryza punctata TaxID=4537 RepID=A0A0E0LP57_ORYPU
MLHWPNIPRARASVVGVTRAGAEPLAHQRRSPADDSATNHGSKPKVSVDAVTTDWFSFF